MEKESDLGCQLSREQAGNWVSKRAHKGKRSRITTHEKKAEQLKMLQTGHPASQLSPQDVWGPPLEHHDLSLDGWQGASLMKPTLSQALCSS